MHIQIPKSRNLGTADISQQKFLKLIPCFLSEDKLCANSERKKKSVKGVSMQMTGRRHLNAPTSLK